MNAANPARKPAGNMSAANKKKLFILLGLAAGGLLLWGRLLLQQVPRTVVADPPAQTVALQTPVNDAAPGSVATLASGPIVRQAVNVQIPSKLPRDLFALDPTGYTRLPKDEPDIKPVEKSYTKPTDDNQAAGEFAKAAGSLVLQTTIMGDTPRAMISGQVLKQGQQIKGFVLKKILQRQVILERDGVELKLKM